MAYELPALPYAYDALEPYIDEATMKLHHDKHHQTYVTNLNGAIDKHPDLGSSTPEDLIKNLGGIPEDIRGVVRNNGGGHVNHTMFWQIMKPAGGGDPSGAIAAQIKADFGDFESFKKLFNETTPPSNSVPAGAGSFLKAAKPQNRHHAQPGFAPLQRPLSHPRQRYLGACLLPEIQ